ncbi:hypothetical protein MTR67_012645 [Solanum verrucosum]|uniref:Sulfotransferase n=1 Tax=Solanum verrucosum TaxID=315347 RepID=A0AAF0QDF2_SOLVR|nr:hypothetical protein MTR67_012645 [Solanum verrucosum]
MIKDPKEQVRELGLFLGKPFEKEEDLEKVVWRCSLERLRNLEVSKNGFVIYGVPNGTKDEWICLYVKGLNTDLLVLSVHMTFARKSFDAVTDYVKKLEGVRWAAKCNNILKVVVLAGGGGYGRGRPYGGQVKNWVRPRFVTVVMGFLGLASYYHSFVNSFSSIAIHLSRLTQNEVPFAWSEQCEESFQRLETLLTTTPILCLLVEGKNFIVFCDASHSGFGVVLMQDKNIIAYASRQLKTYERNYPTHNLELTAVVFAVKILQHYLYGVKCEVFTDNHNLQHCNSEAFKF